MSKSPNEYFGPVDHDNAADHFLEAMCARCGQAVDAVCPDCGHHVEAIGACAATPDLISTESYRRLLLILDRWPDYRFTLQCYFMATGAGYAGGHSMKSLAKRFGRTKASVSKRCRDICRALGIPRSSYMRSEEAAEKSRARNVRRSKQ